MDANWDMNLRPKSAQHQFIRVSTITPISGEDKARIQHHVQDLMADASQDNEAGGHDKTPGKEQGRLKAMFVAFCSKTSLHGLHYIGDKEKPLLTRLFWTMIWIVSLVLSGVFIGHVYEKWDSDPVIFALAPAETPIWKIPFPAVTVCALPRARGPVYNFRDVYTRFRANSSLSKEEQEYLRAICLVCSCKSDGPNERSIPTLLELHPIHKSDGFEINTAPYFTKNRPTFYRHLTPKGVCRSYNMLNNSELYTNDVVIDPGLEVPLETKWTMFSGYSEDAKMETHPNRALDAGAGFGVVLNLEHFWEHYQDCSAGSRGFKILVHNPSEPPLYGSFLEVSFNTSVAVTVTPKMVTTSEDLRKYSPLKRKCNFREDRQLRFFKEYSQEKCKFECILNHTYKTCNCVPFYMPRTKDMAICGVNSCDFTTMRELSRISQSKDKLGNVTAKDFKQFYDDECNCIPACISLKYDLETSTNVKHFYGNYRNGNARVRIFLKDELFTAKQRIEQMGLTELIAYAGGLLGLFLGFSLLSICEIFYFISYNIFHGLSRRQDLPAPSVQRKMRIGV